MDNLALIRVAAALAGSLEGSILEELRQEAAHRYRLRFRGAGQAPETVVVSLRPELPWIGRSAGRFEAPPWSPSPFAARAKKDLEGLRLDRIEKGGPDRIVRFTFAGGRALVAELGTHGANLVLVDAGGEVEEAAHHPRGASARLAGGSRYEPPQLPAGRLSPFGADAREIDEFVERKVRDGEEPLEALRRHLFGVGSAGAALVIAESRASGRSLGSILAARLDDLVSGRVDPVVEATEDPLEAAERGPLDPRRFRLWPWAPPDLPPSHALLRRADAAATVGLFHEALERGVWLGLRAEALRTILRQELRRTAEAERNASGDVVGFEDPERWRRRGEALLAGLAVARRVEGRVFVPDPYDETGAEIGVPAQPGIPLTRVAEECFRRHRRAKRGLESARERVAALGARRARLESLSDTWLGPIPDAAAAERELAAALRREGVAVGLAAGTRAQRAARRTALPRPEGVRMFTSDDGLTILVGRTARDNDRLTFKLAAPDDFWLHARGSPGAHVIVRNPDRLPRPPAATLEEAAAVAAWYSEAREAGGVEVDWTRRKYVRRSPGAVAGRVLLKRCETVRVRARRPSGEP